MGSAERRQREKQSLRAAILDAARELFATEGYEAVTMRRIADKIEYSPTAIYQHFADKLSLVQELCAIDFAALAARFVDVLAVADPIERLRRISEVYVRFAREHPNHYRFMFMTPHPHGADEAQGERKGNPTEDAYALLRMTCAQAIEQGRLRPELDDPDLAAQLVWGATHGPVALQLAMRCDNDWIVWKPLDELSRLLGDVLIRGAER
jgi:AcrR family transcriptional regulator